MRKLGKHACKSCEYCVACAIVKLNEDGSLSDEILDYQYICTYGGKSRRIQTAFVKPQWCPIFHETRNEFLDKLVKNM